MQSGKAIWGSVGQEFLQGVHLHQINSAFQYGNPKANVESGQKIIDSYVPSSGEFSRGQRQEQARQLRQMIQDVAAEKRNREGRN